MRVVLAQILKPASENRISLKIGHALSTVKGLKIKILGSTGFSIYDDPKIESIEFKPLFERRQGIAAGVRNQIRFWNEVNYWKPDVLICCSPTLLPISLFAKWRSGLKLVFDCQENYALNMRHQLAYSKISTILLSQLWNWFFFIAKRWVDRVWLAEQIYTKQLSWLGDKAIVFENKVSPTLERGSWKDVPKLTKKLLFTGMVTSESGGLRAAHFLNAWQSHLPDWEISIIGYCPDSALRESIKEVLISKNQLIEIEDWLPTVHIIKAIESASAILMPYRESKANLGKVPTKFYEALYCGKPILVQRGSDFGSLAAKFGAGIEVDFKNPKGNDFNWIASQIADCQPRTKYSKQYLFDSGGLKADFLRLSGLHSEP